MSVSATTFAAAAFLRRRAVGVATSSTMGRQSVLFVRGFGSTTPAAITKQEVQGLFSLWNEALATLDAKTVADRYAPNALLLPTVSDVPRQDPASIQDYFEHFLQSKPQGTILESYVQIGKCGTWAQDNGLYEFTMGTTGATVRGRYTFIYTTDDDGGKGVWKIAHHHSSVMPEQVLADSAKYTAMANIVDNK